MNRRSFLKKSGQFALGLGALGLWPRRTRAQSTADAKGVELVTVTDGSAVITWESENPTEGMVRYGSTANQLDQEAADPAGSTRFHRVELSGFQPGQTVHYQVLSNQVAADPAPFSPGVFETLVPPAGSLLFSFATLTDMHVGLTSAGAVGGVSSFEPVECPLTSDTCWRVANQAVIDAINRTDAAFSIAKGDLSHEYRQEEFESARAFLEGLQNPYHAVRGNHDRQGEQPEDYFKKVFEIDETHYAFSRQGVRFAILDSSDLETGFAKVSEDQWAWLENQVETLGEEKLFVVLHHAVTEESSVLFSLFTEDQQRLFSILRRENNLAGILSGHSHRNMVTHQPELDEVPCIETAATIHYPGGFNLYRVYTGGYMQTYHKIDGDQWRIWEEAGRAMYKGDAQNILLGELSHRNFVQPFSKPLPEPEQPDESGGCSCATHPGKTGLALGAAALAAGGLLKGKPSEPR